MLPHKVTYNLQKNIILDNRSYLLGLNFEANRTLKLCFHYSHTKTTHHTL